jgi:hypothetical protein
MAAMPTTSYRIAKVADGWRATIDEEERVFSDKESAIRWCYRRATQGDAAAAPEEGAYAELDIEIDEG